MNKIFKFVFLIVFYFFFSKSVFASVLTVGGADKVIKTGDTFIVDIILNTENESINTIEGDLSFDKDIVYPEKIEINKSFISFWVEQPNINSTNKIHFSGIVPGGINTVEGHLFSVIFKSLKVGETNIYLSNTNLYLNDGLATVNIVKNKDMKLTVSDTAIHRDLVQNKDIINPEDFKIERSKSPYLFNNENFIVFNTQDKDTGIKEYEVCEFVFKCKKGESPYLLKNQTIFYNITVKAIDESGNTTKSNLTSIYLKILFILFIISILCLIFYFYYRYFRKNRVYYKRNEKIQNPQ